ncbi:MAG: metal ABC transporter substrate-binding protein [Planctomycetota bacterium]
MNNSTLRSRWRISALALVAILATNALTSAVEPLRICATTPDLGSLARAIGGDAVQLTVFARGPEDPHFISAKPSFMKSLSQADLLLYTGLELEIGYLPPLIEGCRNPRLLLGAAGNFDASAAIEPLDRPVDGVDRSMGDVHGGGNPHYLLDPVNGWRVARHLREKMSTLRPDAATAFAANFDAFELRLAAALVGESLTTRLGAKPVLETLAKNSSVPLTNDPALGGWLAATVPLRGALVIADHNLWPYFARRFGIDVVGYLEPKPGIPPSTRHLGEIVALVKTRAVKLVMTAPYFDTKPAEFVARETGASIVRLAHQPGAVAGVDDYLAMCEYNVTALVRGWRGETP